MCHLLVISHFIMTSKFGSIMYITHHTDRTGPCSTAPKITTNSKLLVVIVTIVRLRRLVTSTYYSGILVTISSKYILVVRSTSKTRRSSYNTSSTS